NKPNIIIIGFDALRPDLLSFFSKNHQPTPHFDKFLQSATVFPNASYFDPLEFKKTLAKKFQQVGYATIYATDNRRFNHIDQRYGFDYIVGPSGTAADYLIGS